MKLHECLQKIDDALVKDIAGGAVWLVVAIGIAAFAWGFSLGSVASGTPFVISGDCSVTQLDGRPIR